MDFGHKSPFAGNVTTDRPVIHRAMSVAIFYTGVSHHIIGKDSSMHDVSPLTKTVGSALTLQREGNGHTF